VWLSALAFLLAGLVALSACAPSLDSLAGEGRWEEVAELAQRELEEDPV